MNSVVLPSLSDRSYASRFEFVREIGKGASGTVDLCIDRQRKVLCALKRIRYGGSDPSADRELRLYSTAKNPHLLQMLDAFLCRHSLYLELEYCGEGSLGRYIGKVNESVVYCVIRDVARALQEIHSHGMIHFDVKPANILVTSTFDFKLGDFGVTRNNTSLSVLGNSPKNGSAPYLAPETNTGPATQANDIYALGITAFELAIGIPLSLTGYKTFREWVKSEQPMFSIDHEDWSDQFTEIVGEMLSEDPKSRPTATQILEREEFKFLPESWILAGQYLMKDHTMVEEDEKSRTINLDDLLKPSIRC